MSRRQQHLGWDSKVPVEPADPVEGEPPPAGEHLAPTSPSVPSHFQLSPQPAPVTDDSDRLGPRYRVPWAELLRKAFSLDVLSCPQCGRGIQLIAFIAEAGVAKRILDHLGRPSTGPLVARSTAPEETFYPGPEYDVGDSTCEE